MRVFLVSVSLHCPVPAGESVLCCSLFVSACFHFRSDLVTQVLCIQNGLMTILGQRTQDGVRVKSALHQYSGSRVILSHHMSRMIRPGWRALTSVATRLPPNTGAGELLYVCDGQGCEGKLGTLQKTVLPKWCTGKKGNTPQSALCRTCCR